MGTTVDELFTGGLGDINVGAAAAVAFLNPLSAQMDAMLAFSLGPLVADLSVQLDASLALSATLALSISDPFANIKAALEALIELQASLTAALALPPLVLSLSAEISASAALSAALSAKLGGLNLLVDAAIAVKIPAVKAAASLSASLAAGPFVILGFDGLDVLPPADGNMTLQQVGNAIQAKFSGTIGSGPTISSSDQVSGVIIVTKAPLAFSALGNLIITS